MKRTPGGRVKNAAVKYQKDEDLDLALKRAIWGVHGTDPLWMVALMLTGAISKEQIKVIAKHIRTNKIPHHALTFQPEKALMSFFTQVIKDKKWEEWDRVAKMFKAASAIPKNTIFKDIDPIRYSLIQANDMLYAMNYLDNGANTKKGTLLKFARALYFEELINKEDADLFKIMRELGLPRPPDQTTKYFKACVSSLRPMDLRAQARVDKKKSNIQ